jgi:DNA repair and recombination RAD54-like protein
MEKSALFLVFGGSCVSHLHSLSQSHILLLHLYSVTEMRPDEYGVEEQVTVIRPAPAEAYARENVCVPPILAKFLRPHQREGVQFLYECVMGLKDFTGSGCILADDMGLGKTLQSVCLIYTLLKTGITANKEPTCKRIIVVCPCSLVKNWENEFVKWLGVGAVKALGLSEGDRKTIEKNIDIFVRTKMFNVLICSYECVRAHIGRFTKHPDCCDMLVCDEAHRLKNSENQTSRALNSLPVKRRVLLTGTPMQNDLTEFFSMVDFTNPGVLGTLEEFRKGTLFPILRGKEPDATDAQRRKQMEIQLAMSTTVNDFIMRRVNTLNAEHLPPKLVQVVCCNLTEIQQNMYQHLVVSKDRQHVLDGKQVNCLASIQMLMKLSNHPSLVVEADKNQGASSKRSAASKTIKYTDDDKESTAAPGADEIGKFLPYVPGEGGGRRGDFAPVHPEWSGKMFVLFRLMKEMRRPGNGNDKIVIISNYTQTLDLIGRMCREHSWGFCRLDGSINMKKRQKMVDEFNDPNTPLIAFLLSSKAGGWYVPSIRSCPCSAVSSWIVYCNTKLTLLHSCHHSGLNLIGGNRLVLFDPDWNPAVDKQAAARCWRDGQKKRCFTYRFLATGTMEDM